MKKLLLVVCAIGCYSLSQAQLQFGVKGGLNLSNVGGKDISGNSGLVNFHVGAIAGIKLSESFSFQPELLFSGQGSKVKIEVPDEDDDGYTEISSKIRLNYINVPLLAQYNHASGFFAQTGPQVGYLISAKAKGNGQSESVTDQFKKIDLSWALGVGFLTRANMGFNIRYNYGLTSLSKSGEGVDAAKVHNRVFQVGVFYMLH